MGVNWFSARIKTYKVWWDEINLGMHASYPSFTIHFILFTTTHFMVIHICCGYVLEFLSWDKKTKKNLITIYPPWDSENSLLKQNDQPLNPTHPTVHLPFLYYYCVVLENCGVSRLSKMKKNIVPHIISCKLPLCHRPRFSANPVW